MAVKYMIICFWDVFLGISATETWDYLLVRWGTLHTRQCMKKITDDQVTIATINIREYSNLKWGNKKILCLKNELFFWGFFFFHIPDFFVVVTFDVCSSSIAIPLTNKISWFFCFFPHRWKVCDDISWCAKFWWSR